MPVREFTILLLDDEPTMIELLRQTLQIYFSDDKMNLLIADNGDAALRLIRENNPQINIMITDISHPGITGLDLAKIVRQEFPHIHIIIQTAYGDRDLHKTFKDFADFVLQKPYKLPDLFNAIENLLNHF